MTDLELIDFAKQNALAGKTLDKASIVQLLSIQPDSPADKALGKAAREVAASVTGNRGYLWGAIGLDAVPCSMNCEFCSLGEKWGIVQESKKISDEEIMAKVKQFAEIGASWIILRTTEFYDLKKLGTFAARIKKKVPGQYLLGINVGEFDLETANYLYKSGVDIVYHTVRLGEGKNTRFSIEERLETIRAIRESPLQLAFSVEPVGIEHTNEEIADLIVVACENGSVQTGGMARIPVKGTPLGDLPQVSDERMAQIGAVIRLANGQGDVCIYPPSEQALEKGANVLIIETGAIPRDSDCYSEKEWKQFSADKARAWFDKHGFQSGVKKNG
ncbi:MAG: radical SAM protein [Candidatus Dehalobacter alkaniphilus]|uniref:radical SAM protein n=1 Tax=Dehalobacter sp. DCM TaxID=2907827 RepID=UPI003081DA3E|nr:radical SAM protein [Dehalobacter sp. DCM]